jgi:hypothetical protein
MRCAERAKFDRVRHCSMEYDVSTYLQRAVDHLKRQGYYPTPGDLAHLSPLGWEHINLTGDYHWEASSTLGPDQFRPALCGGGGISPPGRPEREAGRPDHGFADAA